jgi:hypothetical protein
LGVASLCQWDVLVFLYRHQTTLVGADHLARLLGYANESVADALDALDFLGLVARSRVSQGARLYQFTTPSDPPRDKAFHQLLSLVGHRAGRLCLTNQLRRDRSSQEGLEAPRRFPAEVRPAVRMTKQWLPHCDEGRITWRRAI